jgi:gag-polypeptide of LTR copia-type
LLSIDVKTSNRKITFNIVKGCKSKDHPQGNAAIAWNKLKNKYKQMSAPYMVKLDKQFRASVLKKGEDPEVWITQLEDICIRLEDMGSGISERQFMIHVLNNLTAVNLNVNAELVERLDTSRSHVKIEEIKMVVIMVAIRLEECFVIIVASRDMSSKTVSNSRKGTHNSTMGSSWLENLKHVKNVQFQKLD